MRGAGKIPYMPMFSSVDEYIEFQKGLGKIAAKAGSARVQGLFGKYGQTAGRKTVEMINDFDNAEKTIRLKQQGIWTAEQVEEIAKTFKKLEDGESVVVYKGVGINHAKQALKEGFDNTGWIKSVSDDDPSFRFNKNIYSSLDIKTVKDELLSNSNNLGKEFIIFKAEFKPSNSGLDTFLSVPSARSSSGVNIVDMSWNPDIAGIADTKIVKEYGDNFNDYLTNNKWVCKK